MPKPRIPNRSNRRAFIASAASLRRAKNTNDLKSAGQSIVKRKIAYELRRKLLPYISGLMVGLLLATLGWLSGIYIANTAEEVIRPFTATEEGNECSSGSELDSEADFFTKLFFGGVPDDSDRGYYTSIQNNIFGLQEEEGCRDFELMGVGDWVWPVPYPPLDRSSGFGMRQLPGEPASRMHNGQDYAKRCGTEVYAANDGMVISVNSTNPNRTTAGLWVTIVHDLEKTGAVYTKYFHLRPGTIVVEEYDQVLAGQVIASVGNTGYSTGCHLHFELHVLPGVPVDPHEFIQERRIEQERRDNAEEASASPDVLSFD